MLWVATASATLALHRHEGLRIAAGSRLCKSKGRLPGWAPISFSLLCLVPARSRHLRQGTSWTAGSNTGTQWEVPHGKTVVLEVSAALFRRLQFSAASQTGTVQPNGPRKQGWTSWRVGECRVRENLRTLASFYSASKKSSLSRVCLTLKWNGIGWSNPHLVYIT